jgi:hypothetical protein
MARICMRWMGLVLLLIGGSTGLCQAQDDPGMEPVGRVGVTLVFGTNGDPAAAGDRAKPLAADVVARLQKSKELNFKSYRSLGQDVQPALRAHDNWALPMRPSEEVRVRFDVQGLLTGGGLRLDLELWLQQKKVLKTSPTLEAGRPLYIRGPAWRGGQMILIIELKK